MTPFVSLHEIAEKYNIIFCIESIQRSEEILSIYNGQIDNLDYNDPIIIMSLSNYYQYILQNLDKSLEYSLMYHELTNDGETRICDIYMKKKMCIEMEKYYVLSMNKNDWIGFINMGFYHYNISLDLEKAEELYLKALLLIENANILYGLAQVYKKQKQYDKMIEKLERILSIETILIPDQYIFNSYVMLVMYYYSTIKDYNKSLYYFNIINKKYPKDSLMWYLTSINYTYLNNDLLSRYCFEKAVINGSAIAMSIILTNNQDIIKKYFIYILQFRNDMNEHTIKIIEDKLLEFNLS